MADINMVCISGRLTNPPEVRNTSGGATVAKLSIAVQRRTKENGQWQNATDYVDAVVMGNYADYLSGRLAKGTPVTVAGRLSQRRWTDKEGKGRSKLEVFADSVVVGATSASAPAQQQTRSEYSEPGYDDCPF